VRCHLTIAVLASLPTGLLAAAQEQHPADAARIRARVEMVSVDVSVFDARGSFVRGLTRENFRIFDEGIERPLTHFAPEEAPARVLLLVETSPAVLLLRRDHLLAAIALVEGLAPGDWVGLATYDESPRLLLPLTQNKAAVAAALGSLTYTLGMTQLRMHTSLATVLDWLEPAPGKKAVVLVSTGLDTDAPAAFESVIQKLRSSEAAIYAVALGGDLRRPAASKQRGKQPREPTAAPGSELSFVRADRELAELAEASGGAVFFPRNTEHLQTIFREVAARLRHQYSLGFAPAVRDGSFRRIEVHVVDAQGRVQARQEYGAKAARTAWRVRARPGYRAPGPE